MSEVTELHNWEIFTKFKKKKKNAIIDSMKKEQNCSLTHNYIRFIWRVGGIKEGARAHWDAAVLAARAPFVEGRV